MIIEILSDLISTLRSSRTLEKVWSGQRAGHRTRIRRLPRLHEVPYLRQVDAVPGARRRALIAVLCLLFAASLSAQGSSPGLPVPLNVPPGFSIDTVSTKISGARFLAVAPNGDVLVSEIQAGRVVAIRPGQPVDAAPIVVARGLPLPNGLAFRGNDLYIAAWTGVFVIRDYSHGSGSPEVLFSDMPRNGGHNARALALASDGSIFVSSGSDCNVCEESDPRLATILHYAADGRASSIYARGLRNASGLAFDGLGRLWTVVNQRDNLTPSHTDLPPEELDLVQEGGDYGWPACYPIGDRRLPNPEFPGASCSAALPTTMNMQAHSAPLQAVFYGGSSFPARYRGALFVAFHGSWNRDPPTGYKVVAVRFADGKPTAIEDFVTGWLTGSRAVGRPVGVAVAADGSLYISDDTGYLFRVTYRG
jgi:glucose/arabinose dehydrogenase